MISKASLSARAPEDRPANTRFARLAQSLNGDGRYGVALLACLLLFSALSAGGTRWLERLRYERAGLQMGQYWRLLSAHFVHLDAHHLALNLSGFILLWTMFARDFRARDWLVIVLATLATIDAGLWFVSPRVLWYAGASGLLHGIWGAGACANWRRAPPYGALLSIALAGKLAYEQLVGPNPLDLGLPVVTIAHIYGAVGGTLAALIFVRAPRRL
jgi:rhomboid family GlyGly-CTERM serine protease